MRFSTLYCDLRSGRTGVLTGKIRRGSSGLVKRAGGALFSFRTSDRGKAGPQILKPPESPDGPLFKYVDEEHAESMQGGCFRIGTLASFAAVEDRRADKYEGAHFTKSGSFFHSGTAGIDFDPLPLRSLGINIQAGSTTGISIVNCRGVNRSENLYCLCFQGNGDTPDDLGKPQAVFKINNVQELAWRITAKVDDLDTFAIGKVVYGSRDSQIGDGAAAVPNPFIKPNEPFSWEQETRILWTPSPKKLDISPLFVTVNVKGLIERIR